MIIYKLRNPDRAPELAKHFEDLFQHDAQSWQEREESTLQLFLMLRLSADMVSRLTLSNMLPWRRRRIMRPTAQ